MLHQLRLGREFFSLLASLDAELCRQVAAGGCRRCGGPLHQAHYQRKPRGAVMAAAGEAFTRRYSLCCGRRGCRKRTLPPSLRFFGRRVYLEAVVLLASAAAQLVSTLRVAQDATGVAGRTLRRWGRWWREGFTRSASWTELRARLRPPAPDEAQLPRSLIERLDADAAGPSARATPSRLCLLAARCLAPATTTMPDAARFVRAVCAEAAPP
jgi:hypothetical protein